MEDQYQEATDKLEQGDVSGAESIMQGASGLPQKPQQPQQMPPQQPTPTTGAKLKKVVDGKMYEDSLAGEMEWLDAIKSRMMRTDMKSPFEVTVLQKALMPWLQEFGDGLQLVPNGTPTDRMVKAINLFQNKYPAQMKIRQRAANKSKNVEDYIFDKVKGDERDLFS